MIIHTPTPDIHKSIDFYTRLQFRKIREADPVLFSDGQCVIEINPERYARPGIRLTRESWDGIIENLRAITGVIEIKDGYLTSDPSGSWIYLKQSPEEDMQPDENIPKSLLGNYAGISLEVVDIHQASKFWAILGFNPSMGSPDQGWMTVQDENKNTISLMKPNACPHLFFNPSLTYFNGKDNMTVIRNVREAKIPITEEITHFNSEGIVDNIILRDPGGYGFFIFND